MSEPIAELAPPGPKRSYWPPPFTASLVIVNGAFFAATELAGGSHDPAVLALYGAKVSTLIAAGEWWRIVSSAFLHIGLLHFAVNTYALFLLGSFVERAYGGRRLLAIYAGGAAGGGALSALLSSALSAGASGAVYGLFGVALVFAYRNRYRLTPDAQRTYWVWLLPFFLASLAFGFFVPMIDTWAHVGGLVGGVLVSLAFGNPAAYDSIRRWTGDDDLGRAKERASRRETVAWIACAIGVSVMAVPLGFAVHKAALGELWPDDIELRVVDDPAVGVRVPVPAPWVELPRKNADERIFHDGLRGFFAIRVLPQPASGSARDDAAKAAPDAKATQVIPPSTLGVRHLLRGPEDVTIGKHRVSRRVATYVREGMPPIRQEILELAGARGFSLQLVFEVPRESAPRYAAIVERIVTGTELDERAVLAAAWSALAENKPRDALSLLTRAVADPASPVGPGKPREAHALMALARAHRLLGELPEALRFVDEAAKVSRGDVSVRMERIEMLHAMGRVDDARRLLGEAQGAARGEASMLMGLGSLAIALKLEREAIAIYEELTTASRDVYLAFNNLAWLLATAEDKKLRNPEQAVRTARVAVEGTSWQDPTTIDTLAEAHFAAGQPRDAIRTIERALALSPKTSYFAEQKAKFEKAAAAAPASSDGGVAAPASIDGGVR